MGQPIAPREQKPNFGGCSKCRVLRTCAVSKSRAVSKSSEPPPPEDDIIGSLVGHLGFSESEVSHCMPYLIQTQSPLDFEGNLLFQLATVLGTTGLLKGLVMRA
jgi:hypothetical protein